MRIPSTKQLLGITLGAFVGFVLLSMLFGGTPHRQEEGLFGQLSVKEEAPASKQAKSNYQRIKEEEQAQTKSSLRYKEKQTKENPFFDFYREEQKKKKIKPKPTPKKPQESTSKDFFSFTNTDETARKLLFAAVFRESQDVRAGKPLRIFLEEPIEALNLKKGTLLKGIPRLEGDRIKIDITAAIIDKEVTPIRLQCFDQEDCLEGLYHDALAAREEEATKESLTEELWDLGLDQSEITRKGSRIAKKLSYNHTETILITSGKALLVMRPQESSNP